MVTASEKNILLRDLIRAGLAGDKTAYAKFLTEIAPLLRLVIAKKITSADVDDVLQEVLISIHKARHTYDGERPIMPWLMAIARFRITDHLRKYYAQMRHKAVDIDELENLLEDVTEVAADSESIDELLENLDAKHKKILTMMHVEGFTAREVGAKIGMNESAVKVAAHRAIKKIRMKFKI
ncbi:MAG: sigma-70 family RNA polymerase sigma factor [Proteobacteria bacterium]|nr:sigma-70 family RNA polymerase sigma factor [Pseudomonadota bacterium]